MAPTKPRHVHQYCYPRHLQVHGIDGVGGGDGHCFVSSRQAGVYQDDGGDRNDVIVVFTLLLFTCVSCSLARSSRKRFIALKTSSLEVFAGSHLGLMIINAIITLALQLMIDIHCCDYHNYYHI